MLTNEWFAARDETDPVYLGDGVYASHDGVVIWLRTPREDGIHEIALDSRILAALLRYKKRIAQQPPRNP